MTNHPIHYTIMFGNFTKDDIIIPQEEGLTDKLVLISCINHPDGSYSQTWVGYDGETKESRSSNDVFKAWILMAESLLRKDDLPEGRRAFLKQVWEVFTEITFNKPRKDESHE